MQVLAVLRHRVSPSRLQALGEAFPNKQILIIAAEDDCVVHPKNSVYLADRLGQKGVIYEIFWHPRGICRL
ncbi:hypothetical protein BX070DRAFT_230729 [Coemansia spiralis]|nr:hypothetical protein BX070DRAFT_230729 [Coemansia spiralis]